MSVNLSIKNVPEELAERLRRRATRNHRSLQGELMAILEQQLGDDRPEARAADVVSRLGRKLSIADAAAVIREMGIKSASDSVEILRRDRSRNDL